MHIFMSLLCENSCRSCESIGTPLIAFQSILASPNDLHEMPEESLLAVNIFNNQRGRILALNKVSVNEDSNL